MLLNPGAQFALAQSVRRGTSSLGDVFAFLSGLYFRGKLAYAQAFTHPPRNLHGIWVITTNQGLMKADAPADLSLLKSFAQVPIEQQDARYRLPLLESSAQLHSRLPASCEVVLLGSIATGKYADILLSVFGPQLYFPTDFIGRGDMSRGGLMLRHAASGEELPYTPLAGAIRHGQRPPRLAAAKIKPPSSLPRDKN